jgi:hypothetical protein
MNEFANVIVSTLCFPTDGRGVVSAIRGLASSANTTYTDNTVTDGTAWVLTTVVAGDYCFTADGYWGIVVSAAANVVTVDRWRKAGRPGHGERWVPAATQIATVHSTSHIAGSTRVVLKKIIVLKIPGAETLDITDQKGTALTNFRFTLTAATMIGVLADYGDGIPFDHPIGFKMSGTTGQVQIVYDATGQGPAYL